MYLCSVSALLCMCNVPVSRIDSKRLKISNMVISWGLRMLKYWSRCVLVSLKWCTYIPSRTYTLNLSYVSCRRQLRTSSPLTVLVKYATIEHINAAIILYNSMRRRQITLLNHYPEAFNRLNTTNRCRPGRESSCALSVATQLITCMVASPWSRDVKHRLMLRYDDELLTIATR
jgi:hypothetical protein